MLILLIVFFNCILEVNNDCLIVYCYNKLCFIYMQPMILFLIIILIIHIRLVLVYKHDSKVHREKQKPVVAQVLLLSHV